MSNRSVLVFSSSIQDKNMLTVLRLSQISLGLKSAPSGCSWAMNRIFCCGDSHMVLRCLLNHSRVSLSFSRQTRSQEHAGKVTVGATCIRNLLIWNFGSKKGGAVDEEISRPIYYCRCSQDRWMKRGRTVSEAPFRWLSTRKQIHKFSAVTGDTHEHPLTQTKQGERGGLCCFLTSRTVPQINFFPLLVGQLWPSDTNRLWTGICVCFFGSHCQNSLWKRKKNLLCGATGGCFHWPWRFGSLALWGILLEQAMKKRCLGNSHPPTPSSVVST